MEYWDIYDENGNLTGVKKGRHERQELGEYRLVVQVCIINSENKMLIQQRQTNKHSWPNLWDISLGGGALAGETSKQAAQRELKEELGLDIDFLHLRPSFMVNYEYGFNDVYIIRKDVNLNELTLQVEEVQAARFATKEEIFEHIETGEFINYKKGFIELIFDSVDKIGVHTK